MSTGYNFLDMLMGKPRPQQNAMGMSEDPRKLFSPLRKAGIAADALVLRGYGTGQQLREQGLQEAQFELSQNQRADTIKGLQQRAAAGDKAAASLLMAVENRSLTPSDAMKIYFRQQFQKPTKTVTQMTGAQLNERDKTTAYDPNKVYNVGSDGSVAPMGGTPLVNMAENYENRVTIDRALSVTDKLLEAGELARRSQANTRRQIELINDPNFDAGAGNDLVVLGKRILNRLGMIPDSEISSNEQFITYMRKDVLNQLGGSLGVGISASDVDYLDNMVANPSMTKQAMRDILFAADALYQRQIDIVNFANEYMIEKGDQFIRNPIEFNQKLQAKFGNVNMFQVTSQG